MNESKSDYEHAMREAYVETRRDLLVRNLSNSRQYDASILTISSVALGISLAFVLGGFTFGRYGAWLELSCAFFWASIISTMFSFIVGKMALNKQLEYAHKYYVEFDDTYLNKTNVGGIMTEYINLLSGVLFMTGVTLAVGFLLKVTGFFH